MLDEKKYNEFSDMDYAFIHDLDTNVVRIIKREMMHKIIGSFTFEIVTSYKDYAKINKPTLDFIVEKETKSVFDTDKIEIQLIEAGILELNQKGVIVLEPNILERIQIKLIEHDIITLFNIGRTKLFISENSKDKLSDLIITKRHGYIGNKPILTQEIADTISDFNEETVFNTNSYEWEFIKSILGEPTVINCTSKNSIDNIRDIANILVRDSDKEYSRKDVEIILSSIQLIEKTKN